MSEFSNTLSFRLARLLVGALVTTALGLAVGSGSVVAWDEFLVLSSDFTTLGAVTVVQRQAPWPATPDVNFVHSDAVARFHAGLYYVVGRGAANHIQILDPAADYQTQRQFSLGAGRNLQDIAFAPNGAAYVTCYDTAELLKVDVQSGSILASFTTAAFADGDGLPETGWLICVGDKLYITCQLLDRANWYLPTGPGRLLVFDTVTDTWIDLDPATPQPDGIVLQGANPYTQVQLASNRSNLRVGCSGVYGVWDGGVEVIDLTSQASQGFEITESELGGDIVDFVVIGPATAYAIVSDASFQTAVVAYVPLGGGDVQVVAAATTYAFVDLAYDGQQHLYLADRTVGGAGLRVFQSESGEELTGVPVPTGLPPAQIILPVEASLVAVPEVATLPPARVELAPPWPNPANPGIRIEFRASPAASVTVRVLDLRGRVVNVARVMTDAQGQGWFRFDGRDRSGRLVAAGTYRVVVDDGDSQAAVGLTLVR